MTLEKDFQFCMQCRATCYKYHVQDTITNQVETRENHNIQDLLDLGTLYEHDIVIFACFNLICDCILYMVIQICLTLVAGNH